MKLLVAKHHMAQLDPGAHLITFKPCALNIPSHALPNVPMSKGHTDTGNTSVLGSYLVPRVIDLLDEELLLTYLKFNNLLNEVAIKNCST